MWYAIRTEGNKDAVKRLRASKIPTADMTSSIPFSQQFKVVAFPEEFLASALKKIGYTERAIATATTFQNLRLLLLTPVTVLLQKGDNTRAVEDVLRIYQHEFEQMGLHLLARNPRGVPCSPSDEPGVFHLLFFSRATQLPEEKVQTQIKKLWGRSIPGRMAMSLPPSGVGTQIRAPEGVAAELVGNNLYVLFNLPIASSHELPRFLLANIMEGALDAMKGEGDRGLEASYLRACARRRKLNIATLGGRKQNVELEIANLEQSLASQKRQLNRLIQRLKKAKAIDPKEFIEDFKLLRRLPHVKRVEIDEDFLQVHTDAIYLKDESKGRTYLMGEYTLKISLTNDSVFVLNKQPKRLKDKVFHHPHIANASGQPCMSNVGIEEHLSQGRYALVVKMLIDFLHTVNQSDSYYRHLQYWEPLPKAQRCSCQRSTKRRRTKR